MHDTEPAVSRMTAQGIVHDKENSMLIGCVVQGWKGHQDNNSSSPKVFSSVRPLPAHSHHFQAHPFHSLPAHASGGFPGQQRDNRGCHNTFIEMPILDINLRLINIGCMPAVPWHACIVRSLTCEACLQPSPCSQLSVPHAGGRP